MNDCRLHRPDEPQQCRRDPEHVNYTNTDEEILLNCSISAARYCARIGDLRDVIRHESYVRRFDGRLRARNSHRDTHIGRGKRGRIIDAITNHRDQIAAFLQLPDHSHFVVG